VSTSTSAPWYKYPFVWFALSIPAAAIIAGIGMIWLAVTTDDGLVADDYYKQGLSINKSLRKDRRASELGVSADFEYDRDLNRVMLTFNKGELARYPDVLSFHLEHATRADLDRQIELMHGQADQYIGYVKQRLPVGVWHAELATEEWRVGARINLDSQQKIQLLPEIYHSQ
jgi:hypothetical protein